MAQLNAEALSALAYTQVVHKGVCKLLGDYEEPKLDPATDEALRDFMARCEREIPAVDALNEEY